MTEKIHPKKILIPELLLQGHRIAFNVDNLDDIYTTLDGNRIETDYRIRAFVKDQIVAHGSLQDSDAEQIFRKTYISVLDLSDETSHRLLYLHVIPIPPSCPFEVDPDLAREAKQKGINLLENYVNLERPKKS